MTDTENDRKEFKYGVEGGDVVKLDDRGSVEGRPNMTAPSDNVQFMVLMSVANLPWGVGCTPFCDGSQGA